MGADVDGAEYYSFVTRFIIGFGLAFELPSRRAGAGPIRIDHVPIHGAHPSLCHRAHLYSGNNHHADPGYPDFGRHGAADVSAIRRAASDRMAHGAPASKQIAAVNRVQHSTQNLLQRVAFVFGAAVGSFLNVCIYRWPVDLSINQPRRWFCPQLQTADSMASQSSVAELLALGGQCANCGAKIPFPISRSELVTAILFLAIGNSFRGRSRCVLDFRFVPDHRNIHRF